MNIYHHHPLISDTEKNLDRCLFEIIYIICYKNVHYLKRRRRSNNTLNLIEIEISLYRGVKDPLTYTGWSGLSPKSQLDRHSKCDV